ncbi:hypothetical protein VDG05_20890 [Xanthomonas campestris pv. raphani]|uniref:hypothetical protein n=1 Tax=Xanthomonas campestris TaxID=339 RepID=UPI002B22C6D9|nr:hypothetical protein [Xanthomonas campestris]MEA9886743.1 hypothetical protein [Xanthomonas campestris pv. raphani]MEB2183011.1 hypothetical protein [Xanthomonas campestris pv. campestris]
MILNDEVCEKLWDGTLSICFFVSDGQCVWVLDGKENFSLDGEKDYKAYLSRGYITNDQYEAACRDFRGGALKLNSSNFHQYLNNSSAKIVPMEELREFFLSSCIETDIILDKVEGYYLFGDEISPEICLKINHLASKLPNFYINFDRRIYMHLDGVRLHEDLAYGDWSSKNGDFSFLIPDNQRYWMKNSRDYWKIKSFSC